MDCPCNGRIESHKLCQEYKKIAPPKKPRGEVFAPDGVVIKGDIPCDLCDIYENVNHYCTECNQNLCNWCNHLHLRSKASFKHHSINIQLWEKHREVMRCPHHKDWYQNIYCTYCHKLVCGQCSRTSNMNDPRPCFFSTKREEMQHRVKLYKQGKITLQGMTLEEHKMFRECLMEERNSQIEMVDQLQEKMMTEIQETGTLIHEYKERFEAWYQQICEDFVAKIQKYKKKAANLKGRELIRLYKYAQNDINKPRENVPPVYNIPPPKFIPGRPGSGPVEEQFGKIEYDDLHLQWKKHIMLHNFLCTD
ncbi:probable E3 ubiquitin-protein ligase MID2 [Saccostrea echinata]|uniref:probable E3 ubiquitin-protein ligase MID2 n=1 Tax=Saccostrea echinata TaxID=191078 RepID=UPI002A81D6D9|nr:probable E3 ubiquitin-protein ligase MID2 [Saccostrea echinata]